MAPGGIKRITLLSGVFFFPLFFLFCLIFTRSGAVFWFDSGDVLASLPLYILFIMFA